MQLSAAYFDAMFQDTEDPWRFRTRWYEQRKRALTLACLPAPRYGRAYEPGCANGELSAALAMRCDSLLVSDGSSVAVDLARRRLHGLSHVEVRQAWLPQQWPEGRFDLVVFSELGFYFDAAQLEAVIARLREGLNPSATVLACHWRHPVADCDLDGDAVHRRLRALLQLPSVGAHEEEDFLLEVWCGDGRSVAQREGFA